MSCLSQLVFDALLAGGSVKELKCELAFLRAERNRLSQEFLRAEGKLVERQRRVVEALAQRQEEALK